ncbi:hypothetical protein FOHLNKBM_6335 [Methylobacterium longum]|nr:hypothetical protein FOHLNKBM_6335 [Methylobacterium longum]
MRHAPVRPAASMTRPSRVSSPFFGNGAGWIAAITNNSAEYQYVNNSTLPFAAHHHSPMSAFANCYCNGYRWKSRLETAALTS